MDYEHEWKQALARAALPGAASVTFTKKVSDKENTISYGLISRRPDGVAMPDARDYEMLKPIMGPLERLSAGQKDDFSAELGLTSLMLTLR